MTSTAGARRGPTVDLSTALIVIAGGGTAGHTSPALAVARALVARGHRTDRILFVGSRRGLEARLVPEAGFDVVLLPGRGIARRLTMDNIGAVLGLISAFFRSLALVLRRRPAVVLSVGGYAAAPYAVAALLLRVPVVVAESNGIPGAVNRVVGRWAKAAAVAFPDTGLPRAVLTGNPVRPEILSIDHGPAAKAGARRLLGLPDDRAVLAVTGGSLGAGSLNRAALGLAQDWADRHDVAIYHVVGRRDWADISARRPTLPDGGLVYKAVEYETHMAEMFVAADLVCSRAGGTTVAELTVIGVPSILVPLPIAPNDHQAFGARRLADAGAAVVVLDRDLTAATLAAVAGPILTDRERLTAMADAARSLGRPDAADAVAGLLYDQVGGRGTPGPEGGEQR
jgi:UDP-N-acetylglucosamine--N-acetylmuramyl-(pentapeptide) pyrophosphoryl-undecaprenol N-acetylglucosamine transferase